MTTIFFNRAAERELAAAVDYYERESPGLGARFLDEIYHALILLSRHPEAGSVIRGSIRRLVLPKFPFSVMYRPFKGRKGLRILAVAHHSRRPDYWITRR